MNKNINFESRTRNIIVDCFETDRLGFIVKPSDGGHFKRTIFGYGIKQTDMNEEEFEEFISVLKALPEEKLPQKDAVIEKLQKIYELQKDGGIENSNASEIMEIIEEIKAMNLDGYFTVEVEEMVNQFESTESMDTTTEKNMFEGLPVNGIYITENTETEVTKGFNAGTFAGYPAEISTYKVHENSKMFVEIDYRDPKQTGWPKTILLFVDKNGKYEVILPEDLNNKLKEYFKIDWDELQTGNIEALKYDYFDEITAGEETYGLGHYMRYPERISKFPPIIPEDMAKSIINEQREKDNYSIEEQKRNKKIKFKINNEFSKTSFWAKIEMIKMY